MPHMADKQRYVVLGPNEIVRMNIAAEMIYTHTPSTLQLFGWAVIVEKRRVVCDKGLFMCRWFMVDYLDAL